MSRFRRRRTSLLAVTAAAAAAVCFNGNGVESASVRGVVGGGGEQHRPQQQQRRQQQHQQHHQQQQQRRASLNDKAQEQNPNRRDVYSGQHSGKYNRDDPTPRPTSKPLQSAVSGTTTTSTSTTTTTANGVVGLSYYPLWSLTFKGCTAGLRPPSNLVNSEQYSNVQYIFDNLADCCAAWFDSSGGVCLSNGQSGGGVGSGSGGGGGMSSYSSVVMEEEEDNDGGEEEEAVPSSSYSSYSSYSNDHPPQSEDSNTEESHNNNNESLSIPTSKPTRRTKRPTPQTASKDPVDGANAPTPPTFASIGAVVTDDVTRGPTNNPTAFETPWPTLTSTDSQWNNLNAFTTTILNDTPAPNTLPPTQYPTYHPTYFPTPPPTTLSPTPYPTTELEGLSWVHNALDTTILYQESFDNGIIPLGEWDNDYFAWSKSGNGDWSVHEVLGQDSYDGKWHVASTGGHGVFAIESKLILTIGGVENSWYDSLLSRSGGGYVTFGINTNAEFEYGDQLVFKVDDTILGYWIDPNEGWERLNVYLPPSVLLDVNGVDGSDAGNREGMVHELSWTYNYFGSVDPNTDRRGVVQLDGLMIEATTGDMLLSDTDLQTMQTNPNLIQAINLHHSQGDVGWEVKPDSNAFVGSYVLSATTRKIIRAVNGGNVNTISTFSGKATMSFTIITGPYGGIVEFFVYSQITFPIELLEVSVDGTPVNAITAPSDGWESHSVEVPQGKHVITISHISNPEDRAMDEIEGFGSPGSSKIDGLRYVEHIDPALLTPVPTGEPTPEPSAEPTVYTIPPQNYCGTDLGSIQATCYTEEPPLTCDPANGIGCPIGLSCWGNVSCDIPVGYSMAWMTATMHPTPSPTPNRILPPQNYCGKGLTNIRETCYTEEAQTCNDDDGPCPHGSFCWGNIGCEVPEDYVWPQQVVLNNYCGLSLGSIKAMCASGNLPTCNDDDPPCPSGTYCWGKVECDPIDNDGMGLMSAAAAAADVTTPGPTPAPELQNYCGKNLPTIRSTCASGDLPTCNDDDPACPEGTYCWGKVECDPLPATPNPTRRPTPNPTEKTVESFLSSFFSSNSGVQNDNSEELQEDEEEIATWSMMSTPQEGAPGQQVQVANKKKNCGEGLSSVQGLPECCVPDPSFLGDGACDAYAPYNTQECGYDLGDCCTESCNTEGTAFGCAAKEGDAYGPFGYFCLDPRYGSIDEDNCGAENREWVGDGGCDPEYNTAECGWDGGDCCRQSCDTTFAYYECGREAQPFDCKDPNIIYRADYAP